MRSFVLLFLALALLLPALAAQNTFTVPSWVGVKKASSYEYYLFGYSSTSPYQPVHMQQIYDVTDIPIPAAPIKSMAFRRSSYVGNTHYAATATVSVTMSMGPNDSTSASTTFASNLGTTPPPVNVFSGNVNLPPAPLSSTPQWEVDIPFNPPFQYIAAAGKSLVVDITCTSVTWAGSTGSWYRDAHQAASGLRDTNGSTWSKCLFSNGKYNSSIGYSRPTIGGQWYVYYYNAPANAAGLGTMGVQGVGSTWMGMTLPISLTPFGAPNCGIASDILVVVALTPGSSYARWPTQNIPNDPALANAVFYDQGLIVDPPANTLGLVSCWPSKWTIGDGINPPGCLIYKYRDTTPPSTTGSKQFKAISTRFTY